MGDWARILHEVLGEQAQHARGQARGQVARVQLDGDAQDEVGGAGRVEVLEPLAEEVVIPARRGREETQAPASRQVGRPPGLSPDGAGTAQARQLLKGEEGGRRSWGVLQSEAETLGSPGVEASVTDEGVEVVLPGLRRPFPTPSHGFRDGRGLVVPERERATERDRAGEA